MVFPGRARAAPDNSSVCRLGSLTGHQCAYSDCRDGVSPEAQEDYASPSPTERHDGDIAGPAGAKAESLGVGKLVLQGETGGRSHAHLVIVGDRGFFLTTGIERRQRHGDNVVFEIARVPNTPNITGTVDTFSRLARSKGVVYIRPSFIWGSVRGVVPSNR